MTEIQHIPGMAPLWRRTTGHPAIRIAVLDGAVDRSHPCFEGAALTRHQPWPSLDEGEGLMTTHGTHVASLIFGQHHSEIQGVAPGCTGFWIPVFCNRRRKTPQLDLARAIEAAVEAGAHLINLSGGQLAEGGEAEDWLEQAVETCRRNHVLLVAAAGNNGCRCLHVPAALPAALAVGALSESGEPLDHSNWGDVYLTQGLLAPGENVLGAKPGGETIRMTGTSFATPIVTGVAALLLSLQIEAGRKPDPREVREVLLESSDPCDLPDPEVCRRFLVGKLNIKKAERAMSETTPVPEVQPAMVEAACACQVSEPPRLPPMPVALPPAVSPAEVTPSQAPPGSGTGLAYVLGTLGYDFGTEARRDSFKQLMPPYSVSGTVVPANPYDARQMVDYLQANPSEARALIWTVNLELTPIYAIEPEGPFARDVYGVLVEMLAGQVATEDRPEYIERVSVPGRLCGRSVRLFSGQMVPVIEPQNTRGLYGWRVNALIDAAVDAALRHKPKGTDRDALRRSLFGFLSRVYFDLRNLGVTSRDRALNFAATNAFQAAHTFSEAVAMAMELDGIEVERSPFCRMDSDCWDVKLKFFDPENSRRARRVFRFTIDVSDVIPVTLGEVRSWSTPD